MKEEIKNRIAYLEELKCDINALYLVSRTKYEKGCLAERNMQISMELSFLNKLLQYDVSGHVQNYKDCKVPCKYRDGYRRSVLKRG